MKPKDVKELKPIISYPRTGGPFARKTRLSNASKRSGKVLKRSGGVPENRGYRKYVEKLPCFVCFVEWWRYILTQSHATQADLIDAMLECPTLGHQKTPSEAAHLGLSSSRRGLGQKYPDETCGPLCAQHHRTGRDAIHRIADFWKHHKLPRDPLIRMLQRVYKARKKEGLEK